MKLIIILAVILVLVIGPKKWRRFAIRKGKRYVKKQIKHEIRRFRP